MKHSTESRDSVPATNQFNKKKTGWTPQSGQNQSLDIYLGMLQQDVMNIKPRKNKHSNLKSPHQRALKELKEMTEIVIKPADKGGAIVIWSKEQYTRMF